MDKYKEELIKRLDIGEVKCIECGSTDIGVDNWNMFEGERDWFYYCRECDVTFTLKQSHKI